MPRVPVTVDDLAAMPEDGNRYEIIDGELFVTPALLLYHQRAQMSLVARLLPYARSIGLELFAAPTDVRVSRITQVEPDLIALQQMTDAVPSTRWIAMSRLLLAVEILSPSTGHLDRERKRRLYLTEGVQEYWIVDTAARVVDVWTPHSAEPRVVCDVLHWQPRPDRAALVVDVGDVFAEVHA